MVDTSGQANLRSINLVKGATGFAEEANIFKQFALMKTTSAREIRWFQKTAGFLDTTDTSGITASQIDFVAPLALPEVAEQSWTRNTSYAKKFFLESPTIPLEDDESDVDVVQDNLRDLTRAVQRRVDNRAWDVLTESQSATNINSTTTTSVGGDQWDAASGLNPVKDVYDALRQIATNSYPIDNAVLAVSPKDYMSLAVYVYNQGAQAPAHGDAAVSGRRLLEFAGCRVVVSANVTADYAAVFIPEVSISGYQFKAINAEQIRVVGIGVKIRVWEEIEFTLDNPKSVTLIVDTQT